MTRETVAFKIEQSSRPGGDTCQLVTQDGGLKYDDGRHRTGLSVLNGIDRLAPAGLFRFECDGAVKSRKHFHTDTAATGRT